MVVGCARDDVCCLYVGDDKKRGRHGYEDDSDHRRCKMERQNQERKYKGENAEWSHLGQYRWKKTQWKTENMMTASCEEGHESCWRTHR